VHTWTETVITGSKCFKHNIIQISPFTTTNLPKKTTLQWSSFCTHIMRSHSINPGMVTSNLAKHTIRYKSPGIYISLLLMITPNAFIQCILLYSTTQLLPNYQQELHDSAPRGTRFSRSIKATCLYYKTGFQPFPSKDISQYTWSHGPIISTDYILCNKM
jgi:hypothetical protein